MENGADGINSRLNTTEEKIDDIEAHTIKTTQKEAYGGEKTWKCWVGQKSRMVFSIK